MKFYILKTRNEKDTKGGFYQEKNGNLRALSNKKILANITYAWNIINSNTVDIMYIAHNEY